MAVKEKKNRAAIIAMILRCTINRVYLGCDSNWCGVNSLKRLTQVGDGAPWIADQMEKKFGAQVSYLIDFYHVCDYLSAAGKALHNEEPARKIWMDEQKIRLKTHQANAVLQELQTHLELPTVTDGEAPVRQCYRYLSNRPNQLNYQDAIKHSLPIGSGEIESAHRYIVQQRMKRPGTWWCEDNAEHMLALRLNRANRLWDIYWQQTSNNQRM